MILEKYKNNYGYRDKFQKVKANLTKTNLSELLTDEEREMAFAAAKEALLTVANKNIPSDMY